MKKGILLFLPANLKISSEKYESSLSERFDDYVLIGKYQGDFKGFISYLSTVEYKDGEVIVVIPSVKQLDMSAYKILELMIEVYEKYGFRLYSIEDPWVYWLTSLTGEDWNQLKAFIEWMLKETVEKRRNRQVEAWRKGKRRGRPPAMDLKTVAHYVKRYRELALKNKKALWLIAKAEGHKISYRRFLEKINKVLESNKI